VGAATSSLVGSARSTFGRIGSIGCRSDDSDELRLRKQTLVLASVSVAFLATFWWATLLALGRPLAAAIPMAYQVIAIVGLVAFARTGAFRPYRLVILGLMLVLPFVLQWALGGFVNASVVCLWSLTTALSALFFYGPRGAVPWFSGFLVLLVVSGLVDPVVAVIVEPVPDGVRLLFFVLNVSCVAIVLYLLLEYFVIQRDRALASSERLLLNVLPASIAARLKRDPGTIAETHHDVAVLFADVVDFTPFAERAEPGAVVRLLEDVFGRFDTLAARHGLEKIKTIGDAYMVVGGVPEPRPGHVEAIAEMALDMLAAVGEATAEGRPVDVRIGIDVGPVIAGVIGRRKFAYDLWGDTVNTAARMESHGLPGRIHVSSRVESALRGRYRFERRGGVEVKGKGELATYFLVGRLAAPSELAAGC
jgi:class 3 adenylate cyclase